MTTSPQCAEAHFLKARLAWILNDSVTVEQELSCAEKLGYSGPALDGLKGLSFYRADQKAKAEPLLRSEFNVLPGRNPEVADALTRLYLAAFRLNDAANVLDFWMREAPQDARPYLLQAEIDLRTHATSDVIINRYQEALWRDPSLDRARLGLANQLHLSRRYREAASEYTKYLEHQLDDPTAYVAAGQNALELNDETTAETLLERAISLAPHDSEALAARAMLYVHRGELEKALVYFNQSIKINQFDHWTRYQRMLTLSRLGRKAEAYVDATDHRASQSGTGSFHRD